MNKDKISDYSIDEGATGLENVSVSHSIKRNLIIYNVIYLWFS